MAHDLALADRNASLLTSCWSLAIYPRWRLYHDLKIRLYSFGDLTIVHCPNSPNCHNCDTP